ncbi:hypothetical protein MCETHM1_02311 [Flavobacteriaceae bacterium]
MRKLIICVLIFTLGIFKINAQNSNNDRIITAVSFDKEKIILNNVNCYNYLREGNEFKILDLNQKELIIGKVEKNSNNEFECVVTFVEINKQFSNKKMIGRNGIIFGLVNSNVIEKNFEFNKEKLNKFIDEFNEIK